MKQRYEFTTNVYFENKNKFECGLHKFDMCFMVPKSKDDPDGIRRHPSYFRDEDELKNFVREVNRPL